MADPCRVREAVTADTAAMVAIERVSFSDPWSVEALASALGPLTLVAVDGATVMGYVVSRYAADEGEILVLAVRPELRGRGV
ncbi:MAG TPA: GNAT family N-acetyltransferase, partial [Gemmatimonadales bacterium]